MGETVPTPFSVGLEVSRTRFVDLAMQNDIVNQIKPSNLLEWQGYLSVYINVYLICSRLF